MSTTSTILLYVILLFILLAIGLYNLIYSVRVRNVETQLGVDLPMISIVLLRISAYFIIASLFIIAYFGLSAA